MLHDTQFDIAEPADDWAERNEYWLAAAQKNVPFRRRRARNTQPLILCGHGVSMRIEHGALIIRDGFTHYPQEQARYIFHPGDLALPPRIVLLDGSGTLSFDVLSWLGEQGVALARVKWSGETAIVASGSGYASDAAKVAWQRETFANQIKRMDFALEMIIAKVQQSLITLKTHFPETEQRAESVAIIEKCLGNLNVRYVSTVQDILALEGEAAWGYFATWRELKLKWKGLSRRPLPTEWEKFASRSSVHAGKGRTNGRATHPINAMLNYAYAIKATQLHIKAIADGYDPTLGIVHHTQKYFNAFVYDLIEPERPKVDALILGFIKSRTFSPADFTMRSDGTCRLSPQLARMVAGTVGRTE